MTDNVQRPLSPHLQIYRWQLPMATSILHRITGSGLAAGAFMLLWMLWAAATGPAAFQAFLDFCASPLGMFMLMGWTAAFYYHLCNGIRHLVWDTGHLFKMTQAYAAGYAVIAGTIILTILTWWKVFA